MTVGVGHATVHEGDIPSDVGPLFRPTKVGRLLLANRIMMSPMTRSFSPGGVPGKDVAAYYARRAVGGVGLIVTEGIGIDHPTAIDDPSVPHLYGQSALDGWKCVVDAVHDAGGLILAQLWHQGPLRNHAISLQPHLKGSRPSGLWGTPGVVSYSRDYIDSVIAETRPMDTGEIDAVIAAYASAARAALDVGFDGVEVHGAHGYLVDAFLWRDTNRRTDHYGGSIGGRTAFAVEVVRAIRKAVGEGGTIMFRYSQHKQQDYKARLADTSSELAELLEPLVLAGVDAFDVSCRRFWERAFGESDLTLAGWTKKLTGLPTVAVGSAGLEAGGSPQAAARLIAGGQFDMIGVGRSILHDPEWAAKVLNGVPTSGFDPTSLSRLT